MPTITLCGAAGLMSHTLGRVVWERVSDSGVAGGRASAQRTQISRSRWREGG